MKNNSSVFSFCLVLLYTHTYRQIRYKYGQIDVHSVYILITVCVFPIIYYMDLDFENLRAIVLITSVPCYELFATLYLFQCLTKHVPAEGGAAGQVIVTQDLYFPKEKHSHSRKRSFNLILCYLIFMLMVCILFSNFVICLH